MKVLLTIGLLLTSMMASASIVRHQCRFEDYTQITKAIASLPMLEGKHLKNEVVSVLQQEMGPECHQLVTPPRPGIPGRRVTTYELTTGRYTYTVQIGRQVEARPLQWVSLFKKSSRY